MYSCIFLFWRSIAPPGPLCAKAVVEFSQVLCPREWSDLDFVMAVPLLLQPMMIPPPWTSASSLNLWRRALETLTGPCLWWKGMKRRRALVLLDRMISTMLQSSFQRMPLYCRFIHSCTQGRIGCGVDWQVIGSTDRQPHPTHTHTYYRGALSYISFTFEFVLTIKWIYFIFCFWTSIYQVTAASALTSLCFVLA